MKKEEATNYSDLSGNDEGLPKTDEVESVMGIAAMPTSTVKEKVCRSATAVFVAIAGVAWCSSFEASTPLSYLQ